MIERVIENWLDSCTERTFQIPFCYMLQAEGYTILHLTRHCGMELGKDIIALDKNGIPCVFQLKSSESKKITLAQWREINQQLIDLVYTKSIHPSINTTKHHQAFLVTNKELEEEVIRVIDDFNRKRDDEGQKEKKLKTIIKGELLEKAKKLGSDLWPTELNDTKIFLEIYLCNGKGNLPKEKLAFLFNSTLKLSDWFKIDDNTLKHLKNKIPNDKLEILKKNEKYLKNKKFSKKDLNNTMENLKFTYEEMEIVAKCSNQLDKNMSKTQILRNITSCALLCAAAIYSFSSNKNYVAEIEAWTIYLAYIFAAAERWNLTSKEIKGSTEIALETIYNSLTLLCEELIDRKHYIEGDKFTDYKIYPIRITKLISLMSVYALWRKYRGIAKTQQDTFIENFCVKNLNYLTIWGEKVIPQLLAFFWYWKTIDPTPQPQFLIKELIDIITEKNDPEGNDCLPNPYFEEDVVIPYLLNISDNEITEKFSGASYTLEAIVHLFVRLNWKQEMKFLWPSITRISFYSFFPSETWQYYIWRCEEGKNVHFYPSFTKNWSDLKNEAFESNGNNLPKFLKENYVFFILFLIVYPHRLRGDAIRWLASKLIL